MAIINSSFVRMTGLSFCSLQSKRSQFHTCRLVIRVTNTSNSQAFCDLDKHRKVLNIDYLIGRNLRDIDRHTKDVHVRLSQVDEAGGNEKIHKTIKLELSNPIRIQFACFVADHDNLQSIPFLKPADQLDHFGIRLRLGEHEFPKLSTCERSLSVEDHPI